MAEAIENKRIKVRLDRPFTMIPAMNDTFLFPPGLNEGAWKVVSREHHVHVWDSLNNQLVISAVEFELEKVEE